MPSVREVTSRDNPKFKQLKRLNEKARESKQLGLALIEGPHLLDTATQAGFQLSELFVSHTARENPEVLRLLAKHPVDVVTIFSDGLFAELSDVKTPVGIMAIMTIPDALISEKVINADAVILDGVQDAGNVGTIMRTAVAVGIQNIVLGVGCASAWGSKVLRAGQGAHFHLAIAEGIDLSAWIGKQSLPVMGMVVGSGIDLYRSDVRSPRLWLFGSEGQGVSPAVEKLLTWRVSLPMMPGIESLNVATAAAACLYEGFRQRRG